VSLPIDPLHDAVMAAFDAGPAVITAPTGSGKSTAVPRWVRARGPAVVVEPRRVACRGVAARVAELEGTPLGEGVGYVVRDDIRARRDTPLVFVTPGVALRWLADGRLDRAATVLLDEFHERSLDLDLLLALLHRRGRPRLGLLSATLDGDRVAAHLGGTHLVGEGRAFPVDVAYIPGQTVLPDPRGLEDRVRAALERAVDRPGDVLVFLPGKGEIARLLDALGDRPEEVLPLHGGLTLDQQARVFRPGSRRRILLATNVAETSVTLPDIEVVVDGGLVRRTRYRKGRASLTLLPIARDSAEQRRGRAGRVRPGLCLRLWAERAPLAPRTPPEIHRESLVPLLLAAAACGHPGLDLPFLDPPRDHAIADAREVLEGLGAWSEDGLTDRGRALFQLPVDAHLGRLLQEARRTGALQDAVDLVAALQVPRSLFRRDRPDDPADDLREPGCDGVALVRAVREGEPRRHRLDRFALREARAGAARLRRLLELPEGGGPVDRDRLLRTVLAAWPGAAHVARRRKQIGRAHV
jgi:ATP-dependent helicase HrpB